MNKEILARILKNEDFLANLLSLESDIEMEMAFEKRNINLLPEDLEEICDVIQAYKLLKEESQLSDSDLDKISGGKIGAEIWQMLRNNLKINKDFIANQPKSEGKETE